MKTAFRRFLAAAPAFFLSACMLSGGDPLVSPGGAEDFPNTVTTLGRIAIDDISSSTQWEQVQDVELPEFPAITGIDSLNVAPPLSKRPALAKFSADEGTRDTVLDTTKVLEFLFAKRVYAYLSYETADFRRTDTVICRFIGNLNVESLEEVVAAVRAAPLENLLPLDARGAIRSKTSSQYQLYHLANLDGAGAMDWVENVSFETLSNGTTRRKRVIVYGPDSAYALPGAVPEEYEILVRGAAGDTLEWTLVRDADWDRRLWNDSLSGGVVDLYRRVFTTPAQSPVRRQAVYMRGELRRGAASVDSIKQLYYHDQRTLHNGRVATLELRGAGDTLTLVPNDSARMTVDTIFALRDSSIRYTAVYKLQLGPAPERLDENKLAGYGITRFWRRGPVFSTLSAFAPDVPVPLGQADFTGSMAFVAAYVNGDTVRTEGTLGPQGLSLTLTRIEGGVQSAYDVVLDAAGNLISILPAEADATGTARRAPRP